MALTQILKMQIVFLKVLDSWATKNILKKQILTSLLNLEKKLIIQKIRFQMIKLCKIT